MKEETKILSSLALFRELYTTQNDIYGVICEFLNELIAMNRKYQFNLTEITNLLNNTYGFSIPEAVVNTALKRLKLHKKNGLFTSEKLLQEDFRDLNEIKEKTISSNNSILEKLFVFIESKKNVKLSDSDKEKIIHALYSFLLDNNDETEYYEYISGYTIKYQSDSEFRDNLNKIREGLILYSGIMYSDNISEIGSWDKSLNIFIDTEVLINFGGFDGKLYQSLVQILFDYVKEINNRAKKKIVNLLYFSEVYEELESIFVKAEQIVSGIDYLYPNRTAMSSIVGGCKSITEVQEKKADFYLKLKNNGVNEFITHGIFQNVDIKNNILSIDFIKLLSEEYKYDIAENLKFLNYISIQRKEENFHNFDDMGCILLTGNLRTIKIANDERIRQEKCCVPLATSVNWLTNKFWFKLNKGFGEGNTPISFDVVTKAQLVLSSVVNSSVGKQYDELLKKFNEGVITEEQVKSRIVALRSRIINPEEIDFNNVSPILDILSEDSLERFIKEQTLEREEAEKSFRENERLQEILFEKEQALLHVESEKQNATNALISRVEDDIKGKKNTIEILNKTKNILDSKASRRVKIFFGSIATFIGILPIILIWKYGWEAIEHWELIISIIIPFLIFLYLIVFDEEWSWNPKKFLDNKLDQFRLQQYKQYGYDFEYYQKIVKEICELEIELDRYKKGIV